MIKFLETSSNNGLKEIAETDLDTLKVHETTLRDLTNNFMSSEFFKLSIDLLEIVTEQKLCINLQYQAAEACKQLFKFSSHLVYQVPNCSEIIYDNLELFTKNYQSEINEIIKALSSDCFAVREMALVCLDELNKDRESCLNKIDLSERFLLGMYELLD